MVSKIKLANIQTSGITTRLTFSLQDNQQTRAAFIKRLDKNIICVSTQVGCTGACQFCSAWQSKMLRNLKHLEIEEMVRISKIACSLKGDNSRPLLISFMGTGEPMANLDEVLESILRLEHVTDRFAISTSGYNLKRIYEIPNYVKMQFSIISPFEDINRKYIPHSEPLNNIYEALDIYRGPKETNTTLIKGVNNDFNSINGLAYTVRSLRVNAKLNYFHAVNGLEPAGNEEQCLQWMQQAGANVELYRTDGEDINAACGQFEIN